MTILIATGIYPPDIGGPAQYARETARVWERAGHSVFVCRFSTVRFLPSVARHIAYFFWVLWRAFGADLIFIPDTFSAAVPAVAVGKILRKKTIIRTGGDFLWEQYVERTGDLVLFCDFYSTTNYEFFTNVRTKTRELSTKEKVIFALTRWALRYASVVVFSTEWQKDIFHKPYRLDLKKCFVVENFYGPRISPLPHTDKLEFVGVSQKVFVGGVRPLKWKNMVRVRSAFAEARKKDVSLVLQWETGSRGKFLLDIESCYAVIIVSLGDISPNTILEAIQFGKPFILTRETGLYERLKDIAVWVNPEDERDITEKILWLTDEKNYALQTAKVRSFSFSHSWDDIAREILALV